VTNLVGLDFGVAFDPNLDLMYAVEGDNQINAYRSFAATKEMYSRGLREGAFSALLPLGNEQGGIVPPRSVVAPESALGSLASVALSSAQVRVVLGQCPVDGSAVNWALAA
jgi:hypothetical protein